MKMTVIETCLLLGVAAMALSPWASNHEAGFAFGMGLAIPGMYEQTKWILERLRQNARREH